MNTHGWTYGAEHELADWPYDEQLPYLYGRDKRDITIVNSNGIANDPKGKLYKFGGEINTPPTSTPGGQVGCLREIKQLFPMATINYRSNLHIHVRVPGLSRRLDWLKRIQLYIHSAMPLAFPIIQPLPRPRREEWKEEEEYKGALRRWRRRRVSHQTLLTPERLRWQLRAKTIESFFAREVPWTKKNPRPMWNRQPRLCVNLRQLRETDTVEFRHFAGTLDEACMLTAVTWCRDFLLSALNEKDIQFLLEQYSKQPFPRFPVYEHHLEVRYRATVHDGTNTKEEIAKNIKAIEEGKF